MEGKVRKGDKIRFMNSKAEHEVTEVGVMLPSQREVDELNPGEVNIYFFMRRRKNMDKKKNRDKEPLVSFFMRSICSCVLAHVLFPCIVGLVLG
jgi:plastocyanin